MLNHTGGAYAHSCLIDYPRLSLSELHLGKFPDSMEFYDPETARSSGASPLSQPTLDCSES